MGKNEWRDEDAWPLERAKPTRYYLHSGGSANGASGDGALSTPCDSRREHDTLRLRPRQSRAHRWRPALLRRESSCPPGPGPEGGGEPARTCWSTPRRRWKRTSKSPARSLSIYSQVFGRRYRLYRKTGRCLARGLAQNITEGILRASYRESDLRGQAHRPRQGLRVQDRLWPDEQRISQGPPDPPRSQQQQLPALRPQSEYGQSRKHKLGVCEGGKYHRSRRRIF